MPHNTTATDSGKAWPSAAWRASSRAACRAPSRTAAELAGIIARAGTVVWNGPMGVFEYDQFAGGTRTLAAAIAHSPAFSIAGGGDTLAAIAKYGIEKDIEYISTGGGAFLEVLEGKTLPAFEILQKRADA